MASTRVAAAAIIIAICAGTARAGAPPPCPGDCNRDRRLDIDELAAVLHAVFGAAGCAAADVDGSGTVTAADVVAVQRARLAPPTGCTIAPAPTASATATRTATMTPSSTDTQTPSLPTATPTASPPGTPRSTWIPFTPLPGGGRQEVGVAALGSRVFVIGGLTTTGQGSARVDAYDTSAQTWQRLGDLPRPLHHIGAAVAGGVVFSVGGFIRQSFQPATDVSAYDAGLDRWTSVTALPAARGALALAEVDDRLYAVGGTGASGASVTDHTVYDLGTQLWTTRAPLPSPRNHLAAVGLGGFVYAVGGRSDGGGNQNTAELDRYDPSTNTWVVLAPMPTARSGHAAAVLGGRIVVMGGEVNAANPPNFVFPQVELYEPATDTWVGIDPMALPRHGIGAVTIGGLIYVPGGATRAGFAATDVADALLVGGD